MDQGLWKSEDKACQTNTSTADFAFHWPSEGVYYRLPAVVPYDSPIFVCVQNGNISVVRELWGQGQVYIDAVDPYGLGLLYVRSSSVFPSQR